MPSVMDLALCANAVYDKEVIKVGPWVRVHAPFVDESIGFYASVYIHANGDEMIIAYRGTDEAKDVMPDISIFMGKLPNQALRAKEAVQLWVNMYKHIKKIYLTGHSLGGGLASLIADAYNLPAVTFNAPGMARSSIPNWLPGGIREIAAWGKAKFDIDADILHIRTNYDVVSIGTGPRMGVIHNVPANCEFGVNNAGNSFVVIPALGAINLLTTIGKYALCQHKMINVIKALKGNKLYTSPITFSNF